MKFTPERYAIEDRPMKGLIDTEEILSFIRNAKQDKAQVRDILRKS